MHKRTHLALEGEGGTDLGGIGRVDWLLGLTLAAELDGIELETEGSLYTGTESLSVAESKETAGVDFCLCGAGYT